MGRVAAFARDWRADRNGRSADDRVGHLVPLSFRPREAFQFDWSENFAVLGGERTKLQVAHGHYSVFPRGRSTAIVRRGLVRDAVTLPR